MILCRSNSVRSFEKKANDGLAVRTNSLLGVTPSFANCPESANLKTNHLPNSSLAGHVLRGSDTQVRRNVILPAYPRGSDASRSQVVRIEDEEAGFWNMKR